MSFTESLDELVLNSSSALLGKHPQWERVRLADVADVLNGFAFPSSGFNKAEGVGLIRIRDINAATTEAKFAGEFEPEYLVYGGDLLVGMDGDFNCAIWSGDPGLLNQRVCKVTTHENFYRRKFLYYALPGYLQAINRSTSSITVKHLSSRTVQELPLPLPAVEEQDRVVAEIEKQFTRLDAATTALKRVQANLKRYRASVLKAACEGRLVPTEAELSRKEGRDYEPADQLLQRILRERRTRWEADTLAKMIASGKAPKDDRWKQKYKEPVPPDTTNLPNLPEGWRWASLDQLFMVERGRFSIRPRNDPRYYDGAFPFVQIGDLPREGGMVSEYKQTLNERGLQVSKMFIAGTILVAIVGATIGNTGILSFDACCPDSLVALQSEETSLLVFAEYYLRLKKNELRASSYASGGQPNINLAYLCPFPVPLPPRMEQVRILEELERHFSALSRVNRAAIDQENRARSLRTSVLKHAFCGKLVAQEPADEPASALLARIRAEQDQGKSRKHKEEAACV